MEVAKGTVRATGDMTFFVARDEDQKELYNWDRVKKEDNFLIMWSPNAEQFKILIKNGELPGKVTENSVVLDELTSETIEMIDDPSANLLKWKETDILPRLETESGPTFTLTLGLHKLRVPLLFLVLIGVPKDSSGGPGMRGSDCRNSVLKQAKFIDF